MKFPLFLLAILCGISIHAQEDARVYFSDKPDAEAFFANPSSELSERALERRLRFNIALDNSDVPIYQSYIDEIANSQGIQVLAKSKWLNCLHVRGEIADISRLISLPFVQKIEFADRNIGALSNRIQQPTINKRQQEILSHYSYGSGQRPIEMLNGIGLHENDFTGENLIIAVMDAGFPGVNNLNSFRNVRDSGKILGGYHYPARSENFYTGSNHGTMVLSTMVLIDNDVMVGTSPGAQYYLFVTEDTSSENPVEEMYWAEAAERADALGVDIINTSLGYRFFDNPNYTYSFDQLDGQTIMITKAAEMAYSKGILVVASAGNTGNSTSPEIMAPSDGRNVLCVGAVDTLENRVAFSSIGPTADGRIKPDVMALGQNVGVVSHDGNIYNNNGTSFSAPIISGMIASLWQAKPEMNPAEIMDFVKRSSDQFQNPDNLKGYGVPDFGLALEQVLSVAENLVHKPIVYPNPVNSNLYVQFENAGEMSIFSLTGQLLLNWKGKNLNSIDVSAWEKGIYLYQYEENGKFKSGKILKN